jgi:hypothetical protein
VSNLDRYEWNLLKSRAKQCQAFFKTLDDENYQSAGLANAAYIVSQAQDYFNTVDDARAAPTEDHNLYIAHAASDMARILALCLRECLVHDWDFMTLLSEGVEYEEAVVQDIEAGRRKRDSHKGAALLKE